ncbi:MAG: hypothetical protein M1395_07790 [Bacteroidetes bacterium]|nr:hypothetical protein [Bacteroidota bacterium]
MICSNCGFVSANDFSRCPQCGTEPGSPWHCRNCGEQIDAESYLYCANCGAINEEKAVNEGIVCDNHVDNRAIGFCVVCGKAVCAECAENFGSKILCDDPEHRQYLQKWKVIRTFDFEYEAAILYANLEQQGIETQVFTKMNPDSAEAPVRPTIVEILVRDNKLGDAKDILRTLGLWEEDEEEEF